MELTEEDLKKMSPEQIAELQKQNCIFCHIVSGRVSSKKIYEDDKCLAILDINPANPGHILLMPKEHYQIMPLIPEELINHLFVISKHLSQAQLRALKAQGTTIMVANGLVAGQRAPHFMMHIIPRKEGDGVGFAYRTSPIPGKDFQKLFEMIKKKTDAAFGLDTKGPINLDSKPAKIEAKTVDAEFLDIKEPEEIEEPEQVGNADEQAASDGNPSAPTLPSEEDPRPEARDMQPEKMQEKKSPKKKRQKTQAGENENNVPEKQDDNKPDLDLISRLF